MLVQTLVYMLQLLLFPTSSLSFFVVRLQGKYIVLSSGNELVNRLRGVLSGFLLGVLTDRVFVADITYQKDATQGLLSALFEGPGYQVDNFYSSRARLSV